MTRGSDIADKTALGVQHSVEALGGRECRIEHPVSLEVIPRLPLAIELATTNN
jgi:hypothetical protein